MGVQVPRQAPFARVTELVYVSGSNPGARHGLVSSNLTSRTKYRTGVMGAHLALTQEDEDRNLGAVPYNSQYAGRCQPALTPVQKTVGSSNAVGIDTSVLRHME